MGKLWVGRHRTAEGNRHEYSRFQSSKKAKKDRAARNKARRQALAEGKVHRGDNKSIDHKDSNPRNNAKSNLRVMSRSKNAGRKENARRRGSRRNKSAWGI